MISNKGTRQREERAFFFVVKVEVISDECVCMSLDHQYSEISIVGG